MKYDSKKVKRIIANRLKKAKDCDFKRAFIPENWVIVRENVFVNELEADIRKEITHG